MVKSGQAEKGKEKSTNKDVGAYNYSVHESAMSCISSASLLFIACMNT